MSKDYQRKYLRAPYWHDILFADDGHVYRGRGVNISEGGILLDRIGHVPKDKENDFMIYLPEYPLFKNYNFDKVLQFNVENFTGQVIRLRASLVRGHESLGQVEGVFLSKIGFEIVHLSKISEMVLTKYINTFASNLIYLQVLLDNIQAQKDNLSTFRRLASYLGYQSEEKISILRLKIEQDYKGLKWL